MLATATVCGRDATGRLHGVMDITWLVGSMAGRLISTTWRFFAIGITEWCMRTTGSWSRLTMAGS
jgi:hypothetical protein